VADDVACLNSTFNDPCDPVASSEKSAAATCLTDEEAMTYPGPTKRSSDPENVLKYVQLS
jgi:hypothetical protein